MIDVNKRNAYNSFKRIDIDLESLKKDVHHHPYLSDFSELDNQLHEYWKKERSSHRIRTAAKMQPGPCENRLAFPITTGYCTYSQDATTKALYNLYQDLKQEGFDEKRLLVNHALLFPLIPDFYPQDAYRVPLGALSDIQEFAPAFEILWNWCRKETKLEDIKLMMHKSTNPGFPMETYNGVPYTRKDVVYGYSAEMTRALSLLRADYSRIKQGYVDHLAEFLDKYKKAMDIGISPSNIVQLSKDLILTNNVDGYRFNSIDKPINVTDSYKYGDLLYSKDRTYLIFKEEGIESGFIDVKKFAEAVRPYNPSGFSPQRLRKINVSTFITNLVLQMDAQLFLHPLEGSINGFLADRNEIKDSYKEFLLAAQGMKLTFGSADRRNSELFITTNWDEIIKIVPESHRRAFDFMMTHIKWTPIGPKVIRGLLSGIGWTTGGNVFTGQYESCRCIAKLTGFPLKEVALKYVLSIINSRPFYRLGDLIIKQFLPTDDIPFVIAGDIRQERIDALIKEADSRSLEIEINNKGFTTFGMKVDAVGCKPDIQSQYSKILYCETPGYWAKDCFSISTRLGLIENANLVLKAAKSIDPLIDDSFYSVAGNLFLQDLARYGISIEGVFNKYSPKDQLVLGSLSSLDPIFSEQRIPSRTLKDLFQFVKEC